MSAGLLTPMAAAPDAPDLLQLLALAAALGWASGLRLYAVMLFTGAAGALGWVDLPAGLQLLQHPAMLALSALLAVLEFFADKIPGVDSLSDALHTLVRIPAGAALAAAVFGADSATAAAIAALLGGTLAASAHAAKATTRVAVNTSPEPFSNVALSLLGDATVPVMLWLAWAYPLLFFAALALALLLGAVLTYALFGFLRGLWRRRWALQRGAV